VSLNLSSVQLRKIKPRRLLALTSGDQPQYFGDLEWSLSYQLQARHLNLDTVVVTGSQKANEQKEELT